MPKKNKIEIDSKIQEKLDYIGLNLSKIPKDLQEYTEMNFRTLKGYDEKKYKQYRFINIADIEILLSPTNRLDSIKDKYEQAEPLCFYLDSKNEENILEFTKFLEMLNKVRLSSIEEIEEEQKKLARQLPFKVKFSGNYLWQIYYSEITKKFFMIVPTEDADYSTFFYLLKKKLENKKQDKIFVPISFIDYEGEILTSDEIKEIENNLWLFTKDYPLIYEVYDKKDNMSLYIIGETQIYEKIKTLYKVNLINKKEATKFYKLIKALFILQTELKRYYKFETNIDENGEINFYLGKTKIEYETLPEFIMEQYLKSISLRENTENEIEEHQIKMDKLNRESKLLEDEYMAKEKQISTYLECKKTFFGKVKYFFKLGKNAKKEEKVKLREEKISRTTHQKEKFKLKEKNYTLYELEQSYKELEKKEEQVKSLVMDINAMKLKNKNLKKKIENATGYIEEINKHKKSIFEFWKYSNKDQVATLDEGEEEESNISKIEKIFNFEDEFEEFGIEADKIQRNKLTDDEMDSVFIASTNLLELMNKINSDIAQNKEISDKLKELKVEQENGVNPEEDDDEVFNIFGRIKGHSNKERTIGNKIHREDPRDKFEILEIKKGTKGIDLKRKLENILENVKTAILKNSLKEDMYVYKVTSEEEGFENIESLSLNAEEELEEFLKNRKSKEKIYLYKIKLPKDTNFLAFSNIIFFDNKNMTLPVGMNLSSRILVDLSKLKLSLKQEKQLNKLQFEDDEDDFSRIIIKNIEINEFE